MIAITTNNSMSVNAGDERRGGRGIVLGPLVA